MLKATESYVSGTVKSDFLIIVIVEISQICHTTSVSVKISQSCENKHKQIVPLSRKLFCYLSLLNLLKVV